MKKVVQQVPNLITAVNLVCGILSIVAVLSNAYYTVLVFLTICFIADFLDGLVARALGVMSEFGKQMDSLADVVSFGVLPGFIAMHLLASVQQPFHFEQIPNYAYIGFILPVFAAFRLAKFNIDTRQSDSFIGLNTPAMTIFILGIWLAKNVDALGGVWNTIFESHIILAIIFIGLGVLMVSEIPFFSLKFKKLRWQTHKYQFILLGLSSVSIFLFKFMGLSFSIFLYFVLSIISKKK